MSSAVLPTPRLAASEHLQALLEAQWAQMSSPSLFLWAGPHRTRLQRGIFIWSHKSPESCMPFTISSAPSLSAFVLKDARGFTIWTAAQGRRGRPLHGAQAGSRVRSSRNGLRESQKAGESCRALEPSNCSSIWHRPRMSLDKRSPRQLHSTALYRNFDCLLSCQILSEDVITVLDTVEKSTKLQYHSMCSWTTHMRHLFMISNA